MEDTSCSVTMFHRLRIAMAYRQRYHDSLTWGSWAVFSAQTEFLFDVIHDPALATDMRCQYYDDVLSCRVKFLRIAAAASLALARAYFLGTLLLWR